MKKWLLVALLAACHRGEAAPSKPRIVSIGGTVTETVFALGAGDDVVAVDTSSVYPAATEKLPKIGYQRTLNAEGILALRPTAILASSEAGPPEVIAQLKSAGIRVEIFASEPTLASTRARIVQIASALNKNSSAVVAKLDADVAALEAHPAAGKPRAVVVYARGGREMHVFGRHTTADSMLALAGAENVAGDFDGTKPLGAESLVASAPDVIVVPTRGLESIGGTQALLDAPGVKDTPAGKNKRIVAMDDLELLGFGPRTGAAAAELRDRLRP